MCFNGLQILLITYVLIGTHNKTNSIFFFHLGRIEPWTLFTSMISKASWFDSIEGEENLGEKDK